MRYAEMEMKNKFINHARNVFDRAVTLLPRVDQFWQVLMDGLYMMMFWDISFLLFPVLVMDSIRV
jgi:hypothetical protein